MLGIFMSQREETSLGSNAAGSPALSKKPGTQNQFPLVTVATRPAKTNHYSI